LHGLSGVSDDFEIHDGVSRLKGWPDDASAPMHPRYPKDLGLADSLMCGEFVVISAKTKDFVENEAMGKIEFLPIKIVNHKGRVGPEPYFVINPLEIVDCMDKDASVAEFNSTDEGFISGCEQLVLKEDAIPQELKVFRLGLWSGMILIRREVAEKMTTAGLTGLNFIEPAEYNGLA
jgi:hypothetical protein